MQIYYINVPDILQWANHLAFHKERGQTNGVSEEGK